jgi:hypothetical protein
MPTQATNDLPISRRSSETREGAPRLRRRADATKRAGRAHLPWLGRAALELAVVFALIVVALRLDDETVVCDPLTAYVDSLHVKSRKLFPARPAAVRGR